MKVLNASRQPSARGLNGSPPSRRTGIPRTYSAPIETSNRLNPTTHTTRIVENETVVTLTFGPWRPLRLSWIGNAGRELIVGGSRHEISVMTGLLEACLNCFRSYRLARTK